MGPCQLQEPETEICSSMLDALNECIQACYSHFFYELPPANWNSCVIGLCYMSIQYVQSCSPSIVPFCDKHCIESVFSEVIGTHVKASFSKSEVVYICIVLSAVLFSLKSVPLLPFPWVV